MRNKNKSEKHLPPPLFFSGLIFTPDFSTSSPQAAQGTGSRGCSQFIMLSLLHLPPHALLLQCGVPPTGSQVLPANLLQHGLLSTGPQLLTGACSSMGSPWGHSFLRAHPPAPMWGPPWAAGGCLLHHGPPWAAGGQPASPWSSPQAAGESLPWCLEHRLPLLLH